MSKFYVGLETTSTLTVGSTGTFAEAPGSLNATPTISFGDGDSGFYERFDDDIRVSIAGTGTWEFAANSFGGVNGGNAILNSETATTTNPTVLPYRNDPDTGIGGDGSNTLSLIAGGVEALSLASTTATFAGTLTIPSYIYHTSDPSDDTYFGFSANDTFTVYTAGGEGLNIDSNRKVTLAGVLSLPDGAVGAPSVTNTGDLTTGMYWPGDHQLGFAVDGSRKFYMSTTKAYFQNLSSGVEISAGGIDVTGESSISAAGTGNSPILSVTDTADTEVAWFTGNRVADTGAYIAIRHLPSTAAESNRSGIKFQAYDDGDVVTTYAQINQYIDDYTGGTEDGALAFSTIQNATLTEDMRITGGDVGIGTATPSSKFEVLVTTTNKYVRFRADNNEERFKFYVGASGNSSSLSMYDSSESEKIKLSTGGDSYFTGGSLGVGLTNPTYMLEVKAGGDDGFRVMNSSDVMVGRIFADGSLDGILGLATSAGAETVLIRADGSNSYISTGNFGLGTTSPQELLDVNTVWTGLNVDNTAAIFGNDVGTTQSRDTWIKMRASASTTDYTWAFGTNQSGEFRFNYLGTRATSPTGGTNLLKIGNTGDATFGGSITVSGTSANAFSGDLDVLGTKYLYLGGHVRINNPGSGVFKLGQYDGSAWTDTLSITNAGNATFAGNVEVTNAGSGDAKVTLKSTTGGDPTIVFNSAAANRSGALNFQDNGTQTGQIVYHHNGDSMEFYTGGASSAVHLELKLNETTGATFRTQVGIGITTPLQKLDTPNIVIGGTTISGTYRANALFIDNASGVSRFYSTGADGTTSGSYQFNIAASDGDPLATVLTLGSDSNATFAGNIALAGEDQKVTFGTGADLEIYHSGSDSYIRDVGTGSLRITASRFTVLNAANDETMIDVSQNAGVLLYYNNSNVLETVVAGAQTKFDGGGGAIGYTIHNEGEATGDDAKIAFETQGAMDWAIGIDRSDSNKFKICRSENLGTNDVFSLLTNDATFAGAVTVAGKISGVTAGTADDDAVNLLQLNNATTGVLVYQGTWNASTNSPALASGVGTPGYYYIVSVAGDEDLDGITDWKVGDWAIFTDHTTDHWQKIDNTSVLDGDGTAGSLSAWLTSTELTDAPVTYSGNNITVAGTVSGTSATFNGGVTIDGIYIDGTEIDLSSGTLTFDADAYSFLDGDATFAGQVKTDNRFVLPTTADATNRWIYTDNTNTGTGSLTIQSGAGSAGYGGGLVLYSHSHASKPGWVTAGLSTGSSGKFTVNTHGTGGGTDVFEVDTSGNATFSGRITAPTETLSSTTSLLLTLNPTADDYGGILFKYAGTNKGMSIYNSGSMIYGGESGVGTKLQSAGSTALTIDTSLDSFFAGRVAIGNTSVDYNADADDLIVGGGSGDTGITIVSGANAGDYGAIYFADGRADGAEEYRGIISYEQNNEIMRFHTNTVEALELGLTQKATFASEITAGDDINTPTKLVVGESATAELRLKKTNAGVGSVKFYNNDGSSSTSQAYLQLDASEDLVLYAAANNDVKFYAGGYLNLTMSNTTATFAGDIQAPGIYVGSTNTSYDFYNNGTSYFNGAVTVDDTLAVAGNVTIDSASTYPTLTLARSTTHSGISFTAGISDFTGAGADLLFDGVGNDTGFGFRTKNSSGTQINALVIAPSGNVGIGTSSPSANLEVAGDVLVDSGEYISWGGVGETSIEGSTVSNKLQFRTGSGNRMIINNTGVGIGTTNPLSALTVSEGTDQHGVEIAPGTLSYIQAYDRATTTYGNMTIDSKYLAFGLDNGAEKIRFTADGDVGIGTSTPSAKTHIIGENDAWTLKVENTQALPYGLSVNTAGTAGTSLNSAFYTHSGTGMFIVNDGDVGIGTTSPQTTLEVNGADSALNAHFGQGGSNSSGVWGGISLGYAEAGNAAYRKVGIVAKALGDGAARQNLNFLVDTVNDSGSASVADTKMMIDGITGYVGIGNVAPATRLSNTGTRIGNADGLTTNLSGINWEVDGQGYAAAISNLEDAADNHTAGLLVEIGGTDATDKILDLESGGVNRFRMLGTGDATFGGSIHLADSKYVYWGAANDFYIGHAVTETNIINSTGALNIENHQDDGNIVFRCDDGSGGVETYFYLDGGGGGSQPFTVWPDGAVGVWGSGHDLRLEHDGTYSTIDNYTGDLDITNYADDKNLNLRCDDMSGGSATYLSLNGAVGFMIAYKNINFQDGVQAEFGNGSDLTIKHDGSNSYITDQGTGDLIIKGAVVIQNPTGDQGAEMHHNALHLQFEGDDKVSPVDGGVEITGNINFGGSDSGTLQYDTAPGSGNVSGTIIKFGTGTTVAGEVCYLNTSGAWVATNPNVLASSYGLIAVALGTSPTTHGMLTDGIFYDSSHTFTIGVPLYLNPSTSGTLTVTPPGSNDIARVVGYAIDADNIYFQPDKTWISVD